MPKYSNSAFFHCPNSHFWLSHRTVDDNLDSHGNVCRRKSLEIDCKWWNHTIFCDFFSFFRKPLLLGHPISGTFSLKFLPKKFPTDRHKTVYKKIPRKIVLRRLLIHQHCQTRIGTMPSDSSVWQYWWFSRPYMKLYILIA